MYLRYNPIFVCRLPLSKLAPAIFLEVFTSSISSWRFSINNRIRSISFKASDNPWSRCRIDVMSILIFRLILRAPESSIPLQFTKLSDTNAIAGTVLMVLSKFFTFTVVRSILSTSPSTPYLEKVTQSPTFTKSYMCI